MFNAIKSLVKKAIAKVRSFKAVKYTLAISVVGLPIIATYAAIKVFFIMISANAALIPLAAIWVVLMVISAFMIATCICEEYRISSTILFLVSRVVTGVLAFAFTMPILIPVSIAVAGWSLAIYIVTKLV